MTPEDIITLRQYIDTRFADLDKRLEVQFGLNDRALEKAAEALETRLEHLNEFRAQMQEERNTYSRKEDVDYRLAQIEKTTSFGIGKIAGKEWAIGLFVAIALGVAALIVNLI